MNFQHTDDRRMLADSLNRFVAEQYGFETRDRIAKSPQGCSPELWRQFADLGVGHGGRLTVGTAQLQEHALRIALQPAVEQRMDARCSSCHSTLMSLVTVAHIARSFFARASTASGAPSHGSKPAASSLFFNSASFSALAKAWV